MNLQTCQLKIKSAPKIRFQISSSVAETIFNSMIQPLVFYCYPVYSCMNNTWIQKFESLYNRAKSIVKKRKAWPTFKNCLKRKIVIDVFKAAQDGDSNYSFKTDGPNTRNKFMMHVPKIKSEAGRKTTYYQGT